MFKYNNLFSSNQALNNNFYVFILRRTRFGFIQILSLMDQKVFTVYSWRSELITLKSTKLLNRLLIDDVQVTIRSVGFICMFIIDRSAFRVQTLFSRCTHLSVCTDRLTCFRMSFSLLLTLTSDTRVYCTVDQTDSVITLILYPQLLYDSDSTVYF